jgi:ribosomal protein S18 acetylase RimI-like enzyme
MLLAAPTVILKLCFFTLLTISQRGTTITTTTRMSKQHSTSSLASTTGDSGKRDLVADADLSDSAVSGSSTGEDPKLSDPVMMITSSPGRGGRGKHRRSRSMTATNRATIPLRSPIELSTRSTDAAGADISNVASPPKKKREARTTETRQMRASISFSIRPLTMKDIALVYHLGNTIFTANEFPNMYRTWDDFAVVENFEGSPEFCFVAEASSSKEIIGFLLGQTMTKSLVGTRGYIQWVAVTNAYRRHGVATKLLQSFANVAKDENVSFLLADTPADNLPAINMFQKAGLCSKTDHVYLTRQIPKETKLTHVSEDGAFSFTYSAKKKRITIRNMEIDDLYPIYLIGEQIFTTTSGTSTLFYNRSCRIRSIASLPRSKSKTRKRLLALALARQSKSLDRPGSMPILFGWGARMTIRDSDLLASYTMSCWNSSGSKSVVSS